MNIKVLDENKGVEVNNDTGEEEDVVDEADERADAKEGGIHKTCFITVGSMAFLKQPHKAHIPKRLSCS
jgi:hypothetical protein